jgi:hypothetical protein
MNTFNREARGKVKDYRLQKLGYIFAQSNIKKLFMKKIDAEDGLVDFLRKERYCLL